MTEAKRLEKDSKYTEAIELYLKVKDFPEMKAEALRGLGGCYRFMISQSSTVSKALSSRRTRNAAGLWASATEIRKTDWKSTPTEPNFTTPLEPPTKT